MDVVRYIYSRYPHIKKELLEAHMSIGPETFMARALKAALIYATTLSLFTALPITRAGYSPLWSIVVFPVVFFIMINMQMSIPKLAIRKRGKEMNSEVLFAARFLLVKLRAGRPLFNALIDASQSYGIASKYFKEIVDNISYGTPIEQAIDEAVSLSPSAWFKKVLFQISSAIKTGTDVTEVLNSTIEEIEGEQILEIERYGKKLSSVAMFYMLVAIVAPSLGLTVFVVIVAFLSIPLSLSLYAVIAIMLLAIQLFFINIFKSIRPAVNV